MSAADDARRAVVEYYRADRRWMMPADVMDGVRRIVKERQMARQSVDLPPELESMDDGPEFTAAYLRWQRTGEVPQGQLTA